MVTFCLKQKLLSLAESNKEQDVKRFDNGPESTTCKLLECDSLLIRFVLYTTHAFSFSPQSRADENVTHIPRGKGLQRMEIKPRTALGTIGGVNSLRDSHAHAGKVSLSNVLLYVNLPVGAP